MKKFLLIVLFFVLLYTLSRIFFAWDRPNSDSIARVSIEIKPGTNLDQIIEILDKKELIRDPFAFKVFVWVKDLGTKLQAGNFVLQKNLTFTELTDILQSGKSQEIRVTIPEGATIKQIDEILTRKGLIEAGNFEDCAHTCNLGFRISSLEGYLFPSTYFVGIQNFSNKNFIQRLYRTFQEKTDLLRSDSKKIGRNFEDLVKVASMIEREAFGDNLEEKKIIAGIIWKRLDEGIPLGIDATSRYEKNDWEAPLYAEDFEKDSPYNTRRKRGLPPTAISNPGMDALSAAAEPKSTEFYYYLHDSNGKIHFAETLDGHNENKRKYLD